LCKDEICERGWRRRKKVHNDFDADHSLVILDRKPSGDPTFQGLGDEITNHQTSLNQRRQKSKRKNKYKVNPTEAGSGD